MNSRVVRQNGSGNATITVREDLWYKPSAPEMPAKKFFIETEQYRWEVGVWCCEIIETGTALYYAKTSDSEHSAYGMTVNETVNDIMSIMRMRIEASPMPVKALSFDDVRYYLDPFDALKEKAKIGLKRKTFLQNLLGF
ncbi:MAG TPA: hypothetical protein VGK71_06165 [Nitrospirota bacterium]|jgi:hypothetical protein